MSPKIENQAKQWLLFLFSAFNIIIPCNGAHLAAYSDNQGRFYIFDEGKIIQAEYLPVKSFKVGGTCLLYLDSRSDLKMYYQGTISTLEVNPVDQYDALDYLAVYSQPGVIKIIENGKITAIKTNSILYRAEDSIVTFYDSYQQLLAVYYKGDIHVLEDGIAGNPISTFRCGSNITAYVSAFSHDFKIFYNGNVNTIEPFLSGGSYKAGRDVVAFINSADRQFKVFYKGEVIMLEEFPPVSWQVGDDVVAYVDNTGTFKIFEDGDVTEISSFKPDFYEVHNSLIVYGEQGYFKTWYNGRSYSLENYIPDKWKAYWNSIAYFDLTYKLKLFEKGESKVLTYDLVDDYQLYRDIVVVNKGMNICNVYFNGKKY